MSDPSNISPLTLLDHRHHHHHRQTPPHPPAPAPPPPPTSPSSVREYRKGNWTLHETLILITAKRLDDERRSSGGSGGGASLSPSGGGARPAEQRWKWVENYCWRNGCLRSQNQCNDKWDNLLRDYKKVRDHESRSATAATAASTASAGDSAGKCPSYWVMERHERKERNLPTNLAPEVFEALTDVLGRRAARRGGAAPAPLALPPPPPPATAQQQTPAAGTSGSASASASPSPQPLQAAAPLPPPAPPPQPPASHPSISVEVSGSSDSSDREDATDEPEPKRRRLRRLGSSVVRSATVLARTMLACEEKRERRHRELLELEERRLRLEEQRTEMRRQGYAGLISAVNNLSGAIHSLVSDHRNRESR